MDAAVDNELLRYSLEVQAAEAMALLARRICVSPQRTARCERWRGHGRLRCWKEWTQAEKEGHAILSKSRADTESRRKRTHIIRLDGADLKGTTLAQIGLPASR